MLGVTSIVRALNLYSRFYDALLKHLHANAVQIDQLASLWARTVPRLFPSPLRINGRRALVGDGVKVVKYGKKMPGVKLLHQQSKHKAEFIMGIPFRQLAFWSMPRKASLRSDRYSYS